MAGICSVDGCERCAQARGLCHTHYEHLRRSGNLPPARNAPRGAPRALIEAFTWIESHASFDSEKCLPWPFACRRRGYGAVAVEGKLLPAHRYICECVNGPPPTPKHVAAHSCGKGHEGCVNPRHLRWATYGENEADKIVHGTDGRGERHPMAKLNSQES